MGHNRLHRKTDVHAEPVNDTHQPPSMNGNETQQTPSLTENDTPAEARHHDDSDRVTSEKIVALLENQIADSQGAALAGNRSRDRPHHREIQTPRSHRQTPETERGPHAPTRTADKTDMVATDYWQIERHCRNDFTIARLIL